VLRLLADFGVPFEERRVSVDELVERAERGELSEAFGVGTAAIVAPIQRLGLDGHDVVLEERPGSLAERVKVELLGIQTGEIEDRHGWLYRV
jgi:branched-chain amino acid aminotransferase